jgi:hypothetical protein
LGRRWGGVMERDKCLTRKLVEIYGIQEISFEIYSIPARNLKEEEDGFN